MGTPRTYPHGEDTNTDTNTNRFGSSPADTTKMVRRRMSLVWYLPRYERNIGRHCPQGYWNSNGSGIALYDVIFRSWRRKHRPFPYPQRERLLPFEEPSRGAVPLPVPTLLKPLCCNVPYELIKRQWRRHCYLG